MRMGFRTAYEKGTGRTAILFLHGLTGTPGEVLPLARVLSAHNHVLVPWLPGHGETAEALRKTTWHDWARTSEEAFDRLARRYKSVYVAGLSMGACLALHLGQERPVAGIVSMSAPILLRDLRFRGLSVFRFLQWSTRELAGGVLDTGLEHVTYPTCPTQSLYELKKLGDQVVRRLPLLTAPLLVLQGRHDPMVPGGSAEGLLRLSGSSYKHLRWMEDSGHVLPLDRDRHLVIRHIRRFLKTRGKSC